MKNSLTYQLGLLALTFILILGAGGCGKKKEAAGPAVDADFESKLNEVIDRMQATQVPYKGNLTPEKAAQITHEISRQNLEEFPAGRDLPQDPKALAEINEKIRQKNEKLYAQHGTTMGEVMRYISNLNTQERERYNNKLTELFLEESRKKYGTPGEATPKPEVPEEQKSLQPTPKKSK